MSLSGILCNSCYDFFLWFTGHDEVDSMIGGGRWFSVLLIHLYRSNCWPALFKLSFNSNMSVLENECFKFPYSKRYINTWYMQYWEIIFTV